MKRLLVVAFVCLATSQVLAQGIVGKNAPEIKASEWINTPALTPEKLKGKVVLLEFWTTR